MKTDKNKLTELPKPESGEVKNIEVQGSSLENIENGRRRAVRNILAGSGLTAAATSGQWAKPVLDAVVLPAHAQTSTLDLTLAGNSSLTPVITNAIEATDFNVLDLFMGSAHAQTSPVNLGGACLLMRVTDSSFALTLDFFSDPSVVVNGSLSGISFSGSGNGITVSGALDIGVETSTATGTISNSSGTFNFSIDTNSQSCSPLDPTPSTTTAAPTTTTTTTTTTTPAP